MTDEDLPAELVTNSDTFSDLQLEYQRIFKSTFRLPSYVFNSTFRRYYFIEHGYIIDNAFAQLLRSLSMRYDDTSVNYMSLQPDPVEYYKSYLHFFGAACFRPDQLIDRYHKVMTRNDNVDSFAARGGDVGAFWGTSRRWAISADRISWELLVVAISDDLDLRDITTIRCLNADQLREYIGSQYPHDNDKVASFMQAIVRNYTPIG